MSTPTLEGTRIDSLVSETLLRDLHLPKDGIVRRAIENSELNRFNHVLVLTQSYGAFLYKTNANDRFHIVSLNPSVVVDMMQKDTSIPVAYFGDAQKYYKERRAFLDASQSGGD